MTKYVLLGAAHCGEFAPNGLENFVAITLSQVTSLPTSFRSTLKTV